MTKKKSKPAPKKPVAKAVTQDRRYLDNVANPRRRAEDGAHVAPSVPQPYPAVRYHETDPPRTVQNEAEDKALGPGWTASPSNTSGVVYPSWRYHHTLPPRLVATKDEADALGADWYPTVKAAAASAP